MTIGPNGVIAAALKTKLTVSAVTTLATGGVWLDIAAQGTALPFVVFNWQGGGDENSHTIRSRNTVWTVQALAETALAADAIDNECDTLLHNSTLSITGYRVFWLRREGDVSYQEVDASGRVVFHAGGMYRIRNEHT